MSGEGPTPPAGRVDRPALLGALLEAVPDAVIVVDAGGTIVSASPATETLFGHAPGDIVGQPVEMLVPAEERAAHVRHREGFAASPHARPMGVGLQLRGQRKDGSLFPIDVSLAPVAVAGQRLVGAFVRDATLRVRHEELLRFLSDLDRRMLAGEGSESLLSLTAGQVRRLVGGRVAWVCEPQVGGTLTVTAADAADPADTASVVGARVPQESLSAKVLATGEPLLVTNAEAEPAVIPEARSLGLGPCLYLPLTSEAEGIGVLVLARTAGGSPFAESDIDLASVFVASAAVALSLGNARREVEELRLSADHERIARDLHDTVIQRLFAVGMGLQGVRRMAPPQVSERIDQAVDDLDDVIRDIRETIFDLRQPVLTGVRAGLREVLADSGDHLGFQPHLVLKGPVDSIVTPALAEQLLAVTREALSNVARHARASSVEVTLEASAAGVDLTVADDGAGLPPTPPEGGNGLANMRARARDLGGTVSFEPGSPHGTVVRWRVPLRPVRA